jgi:uncharacterized protein (TIGR01244 family)
MSNQIRALATAIAMAVAGMLLAACAHAPTPASRVAKAETSTAGIQLQQPRPGLYTAGQPAAGEWRAISARGVATVVNLRTAAEMGARDEASEVRAVGMRYVSIPVDGAQGITDANARLLREALAEAAGGVLVHCSSGNRAGGLLALVEARNGSMTREEALAFGRAAGMASTEARVKALLDAPEVACTAVVTSATGAAAMENCP